MSTSQSVADAPPKTSFKVVFDGAEYENHEIQIFTFARALSALGEVLYEANEEVNGSRDSIDVKVNAKFIEGSFGFEVDVFQLVSDAKNIVEMIGFLKGGAAAGSLGGLLGLLDWLKGEKVESVSDTDDGTEIKTSSGRTRSFPKRLTKLAINKKIRGGLEGLIRAPLQSKGTTVVKFQSTVDSADETEISKEKSLSYVSIKRNELAEEDYSAVESRVKFTATNVKKKTGWKIDHKDGDLTVKMEDDLFIERLKSSEETQLYGKEFLVLLGTRVKTQAGTKTTTYEIERVYYEV
ncbi:hypothetical protein [Oceanobacter sp. 4_MG-2023]|uniref:hypothetical protein n=1 Tax=Oceanobacter sp. 4_MG-2023 TaxID=3062623 RepID=UPI0027369763|nr:hypothetical protein [Oceanobacter sp. 4_MG-2023]MDP2548078.1 hypothetical protein [Oceanobacter sp. 4_MG-2023]